MTSSTLMTREDLTFFLQAHARFREDSALFRGVLRSPDPVAKEQADALLAYWNNVTELLEHHHIVEDDVIWPKLRSRTSAADAALAALEAEHVNLDSAAAQACSALEALTGTQDSASMDRAAQAAEKFAADLAAHLDQEESLVIPVLLETFSKDDWNAIEEANMGSIVAHGLLGRMFPWVVDGMAEEVTRGVLAQMPDELAAEYHASWRPAHQDMRRSALGSVSSS